MPAVEPGKIRNVAVVGHRGTGKTSLVEAMLFQAGATNRLGVVEQGTTVSDWDEDEQAREMSISAALCHAEWQGRKINLIDTPGEPSFQGDAISSLHVVEGALVTVTGVMGVEVQTMRNWQRADALGLARVIVVNMLDRERADFFRTLEQLRAQFGSQCVAVHMPIGVEHELTGIVDLLHMTAYTSPEGEKEGKPGEIPAELADQVNQYRTQMLDSVVETDEGLMERYLDGQELGPEEVAAALKTAVTQGELFPRRVHGRDEEPRHNGGARPARRGRPVPGQEGRADRDRRRRELGLRLQDRRRPLRGPHQHLPRARRQDRLGLDGRQRPHAREGARRPAADAPGQGARAGPGVRRGRHRRRLQAERRQDRRPAARRRPRRRAAEPRLPRARDELRDHAQGQGRRGEGRHLAPPPERGGPDPPPAARPADRGAAPVGHDPDARRGRGRPVEAPLRRRGRPAPAARPVSRDDPQGVEGHGRYKKQTGGRGQFGDCHIVLEPLEGHTGYEFEDKIVGGSIPQGFRPAVDKGIQEAMQQGELAGAPVQGVRVRLVDGSYHTVDSSEMAFKIAGSMAFKQAYEQAEPVLLEPIMEVDVTVPDDTVGAVNGDLNSRRGRLQGMEPTGGMTHIKAEAPMAEMLTYGQALTSMTGGRGDYHMQFLRYDEVPSHVAEKLIAETKKEREEANV